MNPALIVFIAAFVPMIAEAARSRRNERLLRGRGAIEPDGDVYVVMQIAYPACFAAVAVEGWLDRARFDGTFTAGAVLFVGAKALKYWAIASLGERWTFRVLVLPDTPLVASGPYRYLRHPNYLGVAGEILGAALMAQAPYAGMLSLVGFGALMLARIRLEERALGICAR